MARRSRLPSSGRSASSVMETAGADTWGGLQDAASRHEAGGFEAAGEFGFDGLALLAEQGDDLAVACHDGLVDGLFEPGLLDGDHFDDLAPAARKRADAQWFAVPGRGARYLASPEQSARSAWRPAGHSWPGGLQRRATP